MMRTLRRSMGRGLALVMLGGLPALGGPGVILGNRSGRDVVLTRAGSKPSSVLRVEGRGKETGACRMLLSRPAGTPEAPGEDIDGGSPQDWKYHYLLRDGQSVTLRFESEGQDEQAELVLFHAAPEGGIALKGILFFTVRHPAAAPAGAAWPEAALVPGKGPFPGLEHKGCSRDLNPVSSGEVWLERDSRSGPSKAPAEVEPLPEGL